MVTLLQLEQITQKFVFAANNNGHKQLFNSYHTEWFFCKMINIFVEQF